MSIREYISKFEKIRPNKVGDRERPHKICMLLAVLDLAKAGGLRENKITLSPELVERYDRFFEASSANGERPNPHYPFFYLRGKLMDNTPSFWHLHPIEGRRGVHWIRGSVMTAV